MTYNDLAILLSRLSPEQLKQQVMIHSVGARGLLPGYCLGYASEFQEELPSCTDNKFNPEQIVIAVDLFPYDKDGNFAYELLPDGTWKGNVSGTIYTDEEINNL